MKILFFIFLVLPLLSVEGCACKKDMPPVVDLSAAKKDVKTCICTKEYRPVCGADKKTYSNACSAECQGVKILTTGSCLKEMSQE